MNRIEIELPKVENNTIKYNYHVTGEWQEAFQEDSFFIEYGYNIDEVPVSILLVPLLANILPMSWIYDADVYAPTCDKDFFDSISDFKAGYVNMYPMMHFGGKLIVENIQYNRPANQRGACAFFSGGVDAFCTLINHLEEKPTLITLWGADVSLNDIQGWKKVKSHLENVSDKFDIDYVVIKSQFRKYLQEGVLSKRVKLSGDGWWHGFQHGIGLISHAAPLIYAMNKKMVYIASSFTAADKGKITCASDPTIDNFIRFSGATVIHDGYELNRQDKIGIITQFAHESGIKIPLRVCWESKGGSNCCHCEKCWRTILGIYAVGSNPQEFGFYYSSLKDLGKEIKNQREKLGTYKEALYKPIWVAFQKNFSYLTINPGLRWFYRSKFSELETGNKYERAFRKVREIAARAKRRMKHFLRRIYRKLSLKKTIC